MQCYRIGVRVVGVTFEGRDKIIKTLGSSPNLTLQRLPNLYDHYAISVVSEKGTVGFIPKEIAYVLRDIEPLTVLSVEASGGSKGTPWIRLVFSAILPTDRAAEMGQQRSKLIEWAIYN